MTERYTVWDSSSDPIEDLKAGIAEIERLARQPLTIVPCVLPKWLYGWAESEGYDMTHFVALEPITVPKG